MKINDLLSPGVLANGIKLRIEAAKAIGYIEVTAMRTPGGKVASAKTLADFFTDCASKLSGLTDATAPTMAGATAVAASATKITIAFAETMDQTVTPPASAFAISGDTITDVAWGTAGDAGKLVLTGTGFAAAESLTYTKPATNALRDLAGNQVATGSKTLS